MDVVILVNVIILVFLCLINNIKWIFTSGVGPYYPEIVVAEDLFPEQDAAPQVPSTSQALDNS